MSRLKQYIGYVRDHSGSMSSITGLAKDDFNEQLRSAQASQSQFEIDIVASVLSSSIGRVDTRNTFDHVLVPISNIPPLASYEASGNSTMVFDAIEALINQFKSLPDANAPATAFLIVVLTDGFDNRSKISAPALGNLIREVQATDKWTIVFRAPPDGKRHLTQIGIPEGNILEVNYSNTKEVTRSGAATTAATSSYFDARTRGVTATTNFFGSTTNLQNVEQELADITAQASIYDVTASTEISPFVVSKRGSYSKGCAYYQLVKRETVQGSKLFIIRDKQTGKLFTGNSARSLLGLPSGGSIELNPGATPRYDIFIQSTSSNRKLMPNTKLIVYI